MHAASALLLGAAALALMLALLLTRSPILPFAQAPSLAHFVRGNPADCNALMIVAHADDETIFAGNLLCTSKLRWHVVCVTRSYDSSRACQFFEATRLLPSVCCAEIWGYNDNHWGHLHHSLDSRIDELVRQPRYKVICTHSVHGEYGHKQHMQLHRRVKAAWERSHSTAHLLVFNSQAGTNCAFSACKCRALRQYSLNDYVLALAGRQEAVTRIA